MTRYVKVGVEDTFGTAASTWFGVRMKSIEPTVEQNPIYDATIEDYLPTVAVPGHLSISLRGEMIARYNQLTPFLYAFMGETTPEDLSGAGSGPWKWEFTCKEPKSLTVELSEHETWRFLGVGISSMEFTFEAREPVNVSFDAIAKTWEQIASPASPTYTGEPPLVFYDASVSLVEDTTETTLRLKSITVSIDRNLADDYYVVGQRTLWDLHAGEANVTGRLTFYEENVDELIKAISTDSLSQVHIKIVASPSGSDHYLQIDMPAVIYTSGSFSISGRDLITREVEYRALDLKITLHNEVKEV